MKIIDKIFDWLAETPPTYLVAGFLASAIAIGIAYETLRPDIYGNVVAKSTTPGWTQILMVDNKPQFVHHPKVSGFA